MSKIFTTQLILIIVILACIMALALESNVIIAADAIESWINTVIGAIVGGGGVAIGTRVTKDHGENGSNGNGNGNTQYRNGHASTGSESRDDARQSDKSSGASDAT